MQGLGFEPRTQKKNPISLQTKKKDITIYVLFFLSLFDVNGDGLHMFFLEEMKYMQEFEW